jgi:hypothetical protein
MRALAGSRHLASSALHVVAVALVGAGRIARLAAEVVRPAEEAGSELGERAADALTEAPPDTDGGAGPEGVAGPRRAEPAGDTAGVVGIAPRDREEVAGRSGAFGDAAHARTSPSHMAAFAERPASEVIAEMDDLSTDELRLLLEHEQGHRRRKSVLAAIERAGAEHAP